MSIRAYYDPLNFRFTSELCQFYTGSKSSCDSRNYHPTKTAIRIILFQPRNSQSNPFFQKNNILKFSFNILFVRKALNNMLLAIFKNWLKFCYNIHYYSSTSSTKGHLHKNSFRTNGFRKFSAILSAIDSWNEMQNQMGEIALKDLTPSKIKWLLTDKFIKNY